MSESRLIVSNDLGEFFRTELAEARDSLRMDVPELAEFYLVNLLCDFSRQETSLEVGDEPLALIYKRALEASPAERLPLLKHIGDLSLYVAGFFSEFITRSLVSVSYYVSMGGNAYGSLCGLVGSQRQGAAFFQVYDQLARRFTEFVALLNEVSERTRENADRNSDLLRLYERWLRTGSQRAQRMLAEKGLLVREGLPDEFIQ